MKKSSKYVVFYCDQCDLLKGVIDSMLEMYPDVEVRTSSDVNNLLKDINQQLPMFVLIYMTVHDESYISVVKSIRETVGTSETPVVIYQALPDEAELRKLSFRMN